MRIFRGHRASLRGVAYLSDGTGLVSASKDGVVKVWDLATAKQRAEYRLFPPSPWEQLRCLAVSPRGGLVAAGGKTIAVWNLATEQRTDMATPERCHAQHLAFTVDGRHLVAALFWPAEDTGVWVWDVSTGQRAFPECRVAGGVWGLAVAPSGRKVAAAGPSGDVTVLNPATGETVWKWKPPWDGLSNALAYSPNGRLLAQASMQSVWLFDGTCGRRLGCWRTHEKHHVGALSFSPDGRLLATGANDRLVRFWNVAGTVEQGPPQTAAYDWELGKVRAVAFAPDGMTAAAVGDNRKVVVWDVDGA
jgi:WD40 repeat protein